MNTTFIHTIPIEVFCNHIMPYTYCPQSTLLCEDIRSYHNTMTTVSDLYRSLFPLDIYETASYKEWLSHDIGRFLNKNRATMFGYIEFYKLYQRLYRNHGRELNTVYIPDPSRWSSIPFTVDNNSKIVIGLLKPTERLDLEEFLHYSREID